MPINSKARTNLNAQTPKFMLPLQCEGQYLTSKNTGIIGSNKQNVLFLYFNFKVMIVWTFEFSLPSHSTYVLKYNPEFPTGISNRVDQDGHKHQRLVLLLDCSCENEISSTNVV